MAYIVIYKHYIHNSTSTTIKVLNALFNLIIIVSLIDTDTNDIKVIELNIRA